MENLYPSQAQVTLWLFAHSKLLTKDRQCYILYNVHYVLCMTNRLLICSTNVLWQTMCGAGQCFVVLGVHIGEARPWLRFVAVP